jgi:multiple sugar transport system ATP-binding protein
VRTDSGVSLPVGGAPRAAAGQRVVYGVRPEHFLLGGEGIPAQVVLLEPTGSETQAHLRIGGKEVTGVFRERLTAKPGETIHIMPRLDLVHLFDPETGQRLS